MNQVSNQLPGEHEESADLENNDDFTHDLTHKGYDIKINMAKYAKDVSEFRCRYKTGNDAVF